jgi:hypothetical protein
MRCGRKPTKHQCINYYALQGFHFLMRKGTPATASESAIRRYESREEGAAIPGKEMKGKKSTYSSK